MSVDTQGVLLRYAGGEVYGLLNTVRGALLSVRVAGIDIIPPLHGPHAVMTCDDGALLTSATLTQLIETAALMRRIADEAAEHERVAMERTSKSKRRVAARGSRG
jgi:hypothetical protein